MIGLPRPRNAPFSVVSGEVISRRQGVACERPTRDRHQEREMAVQALVLNKIGARLEGTELPDRHPGPGQISVKITACGPAGPIYQSDIPTFPSAHL